MRNGDEIRGEIDSADASSGVAFTLFDAGTLTARTLVSNEFVEIDTVWFNGVNACARVEVFVGADATPGAGEVVLVAEDPITADIPVQARQNFGSTPWGGAKGHVPRIDTAAAGQINAGFTGRIVKLSV